jgi:hypothetical protein
LIRLFSDAHGLPGDFKSCLVALVFVTAKIPRLDPNDARLMIGDKQGTVKIHFVSTKFMIWMYYFHFNNSSILSNPREVISRLLGMRGTVFVVLAALCY